MLPFKEQTGLRTIDPISRKSLAYGHSPLFGHSSSLQPANRVLRIFREAGMFRLGGVQPPQAQVSGIKSEAAILSNLAPGSISESETQP